MKIAEKIFEKATVRGVADYLIYGLPPDSDERDYGARLDETYDTFEKTALKYNPDRASDLLSTANDMICENASVYLEIGIQAGFLLIADMMKNLRSECRENTDDENLLDSRTMEKDIKKALDILSGEAVGDADIRKACEILGRLGNTRTGTQGAESHDDEYFEIGFHTGIQLVKCLESVCGKGVSLQPKTFFDSGDKADCSQQEESILRQFIEVRMGTALEETLRQDANFQKQNLKNNETVKEMDIEDFTPEQWEAIDQVLAEHNDNAAEFGKMAYRQGMLDLFCLCKELLIQK